MSGFSIRYPFFIIVACLMVFIVGTVALVRMPVDLFPPINIPVVVVATFYSGMPPQQIEVFLGNQQVEDPDEIERLPTGQAVMITKLPSATATRVRIAAARTGPALER